MWACKNGKMIDQNDIQKHLSLALHEASPEKMVQDVMPAVFSAEVPEKPIMLLAFGKAASRMFDGFAETIGLERVKEALIISHTLENKISDCGKIQYKYAPHPLPDYNSLEAGTVAKRFVKNIS